MGFTKKLEDVIVGCVGSMWKQVAGITWKDGVSGEEVARCE